MLSLGYRYVYAIVMSIAGLALCLRVSENAALISGKKQSEGKQIESVKNLVNDNNNNRWCRYP